MTATIVLKRATRKVWLKHRAAGLGGTDVAAVLGVNPYRTALDVWLEKTGRNGQVERPVSYAARRGLHMERFLIAEYRDQNPGVVLERPPALIAHPGLPWLRASLDHLAHHPDETRVLEVKTAGWRARDAWWDPALLIPDSYAIQVLTYLAVTGLDRADVVADIAGDWTTVTIGRDVEWEAQALPALETWWVKHVLGDVPPPVDYDRDRLPALNRVWVPDPGETLAADGDLCDLIAVAHLERDRRDTYAKDLDLTRLAIRERMRTAATVVGPDLTTVLARVDKRGALQIPTPRQETA